MANNNSSIRFSKNQRIDISMSWNSASDLDLLAIYEYDNSQFDILYYDQQGEANQFPFMTLSDDEGTEESDSLHEESMVIHRIDSRIKYIWICTWNYRSIVTNRLDDILSHHEISTEIMLPSMNQNRRVVVPLELDSAYSNFAILCLFDCSAQQEACVYNFSKTTNLNKLDPIDIINFIKSHSMK
jgi:hypothetical protein